MAKLPSQTDILNWVRDHPEKASKRDIARAFGIKGAAKTDLKFLLRDMAAQGLLDKRRRKFTDPDGMPPVAVLKVIGLTADGDVLAEPAEWAGDDGCVDLEEYAAKIRDVRPDASDEMIGLLFGRADSSGDGCISLEEFTARLRHHRKPGGDRPDPPRPPQPPPPPRPCA